MKKQVYVIYKITSPSGKVYIGQTIQLNKRFNAYKNLGCKDQVYLYNSLIKYGWDSHKKEILIKDSFTQFEIDAIETSFIKYFKKLKISLNITDGGNNPPILYGKDNFNTKCVLQFSLNGDFVRKWESSTNASKELNLSLGGILFACREKSYKSCGYLWIFERDYQNGDIPIVKDRAIWNRRIVIQLELNGTFIKQYNSIAEAGKTLNIYQANISACILKKKQSAYGFMWITKEEYDLGLIPIYDRYKLNKEKENYGREKK